MEKRTVFVTGSAQGIGEGIARRFAANGDAVVIADLNESAAETVAASIRDNGGQALAVRCDVADRASVEAAMDRARETFGPITVLVNNAGITRDNFIHKMSDDDWSSVVATHLTGSFYCTREAQKDMVKQGYGKIVFISSRAALGGYGQTNYSAVKAGMQGMTRSLSLELGRFGINVNSVAPGHIDTAMTQAVAERTGVDYAKLCQNTIDTNAIKRVGQVEDIAAAVTFLSSDDAGYITGQILYVAGKPTV